MPVSHGACVVTPSGALIVFSSHVGTPTGMWGRAPCYGRLCWNPVGIVFETLGCTSACRIDEISKHRYDEKFGMMKEVGNATTQRLEAGGRSDRVRQPGSCAFVSPRERHRTM
eukprot:GHVU01084287.1.p1 GENE.GHVU01084287.1~~GHVU01084287.1.p1  ORF type:complete len:113 (+),score=1.35 GHVU01084287.1:467-805(+)